MERAGTATAETRIRRWALAMGVFASLIGCVGLAGWLLGIEALKSVLPGAATMKANTATAMLALGAGLALSAAGRPAMRRGSGIACAVSLFIGAITLVEFATGLSFGIDEMLAPDRGPAGLPYIPGRMAPTTALNFVLLGAAVPLAGRNRPSFVRAADGLAIPGGLIALLSLTGNLFGVPADSPVTYHTTQQAIHTAAGFLAVAVGTTLANARHGALRVLADPGVAGFAARRMLPGALGVPAAGGVAILVGQRLEWYGAQFALALVVVVVISAMSFATWLLSARIALLDAERRRAERARARLNRALESGVRERTAQLSAANAELEAFCYSISHDLRGPLQTIDGFAAAAIEEGGEAAKGHLSRVRSSAKQMGEILESLLELSRLSRAEMKPAPVDLGAMAYEIVEQIRRAKPESRAEFRAEPGLTAHGDARLLRVLLRNLLENAWKFTSATPSPVVELGSTGTGPAREFFVRDNGAGFDPAAAQDRLFRPFHRLHDDPRFPGHGIGLATARRIVERHGGRIRAEGTPGKGATIRFTLAEETARARQDHPAR